MWLYPLPSLVALGLWSYVLVTSGWPYIAGRLGVLSVGVALFLWRSKENREWPFV